ncbi:MAG: DnaD domain protein [Tissierellales bacterium]|jgi:DnaD/phage-associated family protein|nr:DnaD domain protein [Tissierellales bacterium]MBN2828640.1 DnaD domain protein [Tissierellales bacterium]
MNFKLQQEKIDFGNTPVENIFINDFMPVANGDDVKIYLLAYKYAKDQEENFSNETLSKNLGLPISRIEQAWEYWQTQGIINIVEASPGHKKIEFINLKQLYVENIYQHIKSNPDAPTSSVSYEDLIEANKSDTFRNMFRETELLMGRLINPNEKRNILEWLAKYAATPEIVIDTFKYMVEKKNIRNLRYVEALLAAWHDNDIHDKDSLDIYLEENRKNIKYYNIVRTHLGFSGRQLTLNERNIVDTWVDEWHFSIEMIIEALSYSSKTSNPNLNYFNSILENWYKNNIQTLEEVKKSKKAHARTVKTKQDTKSFHNFDQQYNKLSEEELEKMARMNYYDLTEEDEEI